jgi:hypothetical protein
MDLFSEKGSRSGTNVQKDENLQVIRGRRAEGYRVRKPVLRRVWHRKSFQITVLIEDQAVGCR